MFITMVAGDRLDCGSQHVLLYVSMFAWGSV